MTALVTLTKNQEYTASLNPNPGDDNERIHIANKGNNVIWWGLNSGITADSGLPLKVGEVMTSQFDVYLLSTSSALTAQVAIERK